MINKHIDQNNTYECDVLVIGAGPAGASLAVFLCNSGLNVLIIDRKRNIEEPVRCAEYVPANFLNLFDFKLKGLENKISILETFINTKPASVLNAPGYIIDRKTMIEDWIDRFKKNNGRYFPCTKVLSITSGQVNALKNNIKILIEPKIIVGADGPLSITGRGIGSINRHFVIGVNFKIKNGPTFWHNTKIFFLPEIKGGYSWLFPKGSYINFGLGIDPALYSKNEKKPDILRNILKLLVSSASAYKETREIISRKEFTAFSSKKFISGLIPVSGMVNEPVKGNIILTGDAAGLCNPVTGAGIYNAVYSSKIASKYIVEAIAKQDLKILSSIKKEYSSYFRASMDRALSKRKEISEGWNMHSNFDDFDKFVKKVWVSFKEYWQT